MKYVPLKTYLRTHRRGRGLSQDDVAYLLGTTSGTSISRHEKAERLPKLETALAYEIVLGVPIRDIYAGTFRALEKGILKRAAKLATRVSQRPASVARAHKLRTLSRLIDSSA
jgi:DNA-binding XRE family transcriptional regulator